MTDIKSSFLKSSLVITAMTFLSRILGLVRDIVIARLFGASASSDVFFVAFKIPNLLRRLFAEGAFSAAFVPILAKSKAQDNHEQTLVLINHIGSFLLKVLMIITLIAIIIAPLIVFIFAFGFYAQPEKFNLTTDMLRITFPYLLLISLVAFSGAILNVHHRFAVPAFTPVLLNVSLILSAIFLAEYFEQPIMALAIGVLIGGIVQLLFQIPFLKKINCLPKLSLKKSKKPHPAILTLKNRMLPAMFGVSVGQINLLIDTIIASFLITGSISWLYYSDRLLELPLALVGLALATVSLSKLSHHFANNNSSQFKATLNKGLSLALIFGVPAMLGLIFLAEPLIVTLFQYENFSAYDAHQSSLSLMAYGLGLLTLIFVKIFAPAFYAMGDTKTPMKIGVVAMLSNVIFNLILVNYLAHVGLALATSLSAFINAGLLYYFLHKKSIYTLPKQFYLLSAKVILSGFIMSIFLVNTGVNIDTYLQADVWTRIINISQTIALSAVVYFLVFWLTQGINTTKKLYTN